MKSVSGFDDEWVGDSYDSLPAWNDGNLTGADVMVDDSYFLFVRGGKTCSVFGSGACGLRYYYDLQNGCATVPD
ncbi:MAG TPA: hypothetical protein VE868_00965 [Balneolaceae bacterium]|nr:hypothetical protein [Balneolaceae bacterium]